MDKRKTVLNTLDEAIESLETLDISFLAGLLDNGFEASASGLAAELQGLEGSPIPKV